MHVKDLTPDSYLCAFGACPAVFKSECGTILIVGRAFSPEEASKVAPGRIASDEAMVEIPLALITELLEQRGLDTSAW